MGIKDQGGIDIKFKLNRPDEHSTCALRIRLQFDYGNRQKQGMASTAKQVFHFPPE